MRRAELMFPCDTNYRDLDYLLSNRSKRKRKWGVISQRFFGERHATSGAVSLLGNAGISRSADILSLVIATASKTS